MEIIAEIWKWLSDSETGTALKSISIIGSGLLGAYFFFRKRDTLPPVIQGGITREELEKELNKRDQEIRTEITGGSVKTEEEHFRLQAELKVLEQKRADLEKTLAEKKALILDTEKKLEQYQDIVPHDQLAKAKETLEKGDTVLAETLFNKVKENHASHAAEAAYQLAKLAEDRVDYTTASENYIQAAQFDPENSKYLNSAGLIMDTLAQYDKAIEYYEKALAIDLKTFGPDHPDVAIDWNILGQVWDSKGQYDKAIGYYERALSSNLKTFDPDHPNVAILWSDLGLAWDHKGDHDKAIDYYERSLSSNLKTFGADHPDVALRWNNLGAAWDNKGDYDKAINYFEKALNSDLKTFGIDHPNVARLWNNLGEVWRKKGQYDKAIDYLKKALSSDLKTFGPDHPNVAIRWNNLGGAWYNKGDYDKAIDNFENALDIYEEAKLAHKVQQVQKNIVALKKELE